MKGQNYFGRHFGKHEIVQVIKLLAKFSGGLHGPRKLNVCKIHPMIKKGLWWVGESAGPAERAGESGRGPQL